MNRLAACLVISCCLSTNAFAQTPTKLGDVATTSVSNSSPNGDYYVVVTSNVDSNVEIPPNTCVNRGFWAFARRFIGVTSSAAAVLTIKVTPSGNPGLATTIPVFVTSANEIGSDGSGAVCQTDFVSRALTFTFNGNLNPTFTVDMNFHLSNQATSTAVRNVLEQSTKLMKLVGDSSGTPASLATVLADPAIKQLATSIDSALANQWTNTNDLKFSTSLTPGVKDQISYQMPRINATSGGVGIGTWSPGGVIALEYKKELFKTRSNWMDVNSVLQLPIVPSVNPAAQSTLYSIVLNGVATQGFKLGTLSAATTAESLSQACFDLKNFLASFLIPDDALVARFAVLQRSPYDKQPNLRGQAGCFDDRGDELRKLISFRPDYSFSDQARLDQAMRDLNARTAKISGGLASRNPALIRNAATKPVENIFIVLGASEADFFVGEAAVQKLAQTRIQIGCFQARPNNDLSSIAAVVNIENRKFAAIVGFDSEARLESITLMTADDVVNGLGINKASWLDVNKPTCLLS